LTCAWLAWLQEHIADLYVPARDIYDNLNRQFEEGAKNREKLIVLMHTHKDLLDKYALHRIIMFDNCSNKVTHNQFR
jgi:hypothetical protein